MDFSNSPLFLFLTYKLLIIIGISVIVMVSGFYIYEDYNIKKMMVTEYLEDQIIEIEVLSTPLDQQTQKRLEHLKGELQFVKGIGDYQGAYYDSFYHNKELEKYYRDKVDG